MSRLAVASLFVVLMTLGGCARPPAHDAELRIAIPLDLSSLSPLIAFDQNQIALDLLWCQTLVGLDERNRFVPVLAARIPTRANGDISADGLRITYHLRRDVRFADGVAFTSADVAFTYRAIFEPANAASAIDAYERIAQLTTPDPYTVVVRLRKPWSAAVHVLFAQADFAYGILPAHAFANAKTIGSDWDQKPFGTGPFRVVAWHRGEQIELAPNPYFSPRPKLARIVVRIIPDPTARLDALKTNEVDIGELGPDTIAAATGIERLQIRRTPENGLRALYFQTAVAPTNDIHVRRAIAYALNVAALSKAWRQLYPPARSIFPSALRVGGGVESTGYPYDFARAERELDLAGWRRIGNTRVRDGKPLELLGVFDSTVPLLGRIAVAAQAQLNRLGVDVTLKSSTTAIFSAPTGPLRTGRFSFTPAALIGGSDPEQSLNLLCAQARDGGGNYARYCSPRLEALFTAQLRARSEFERERAFDAIADLVHTDVPLVPLYDLLYLEGINRRVQGYLRNMLRYPVRAEKWDVRSSE